MRAWTVNELGHYRQALRLEERPEPPCPEDGVVLELDCAGLNFPDLLVIAGKYQVRPPLPFVPGLEGVGHVVTVGARSKRKVGERVAFFVSWGAYGERVAAPDARTFAIPDAMTDEDAAALTVSYQTSWFAHEHRAQLRSGEWLLVHGGAGGAGSSAIQLGKLRGARVIATAGSPEKLDICRQAGADHVIDYKREDFVERVREITDGHGADVIYDPVGGDVFDQSTKCIAWCGRLIVVGFASGRIPSITANRILLKNIAIVGLHWGNYFQHDPAKMTDAHEQLCSLYSANEFRPIIYKTLPFDSLPDGLSAIEDRASYGKVIIRNG